jgi:RNA polymerase sigma-54 factor
MDMGLTKGVEVYVRKVAPLGDEELALALKDKGFPVARRTVSKYREQLGIPVARLRKQ